MPKRSDLPDIDLSKIELPKQISDRLPDRKRTNPLLPIAGFVAIGAAIAAAWWLITSPVTGPRIRRAVNDLKARMNGETNDLVRYDDDEGPRQPPRGLADRQPLVDDRPIRTRRSDGMTDLGDGVPVGPGEMPEGAPLPLTNPISLTYAAPAPAGAASRCAHVTPGVPPGR